MRKAFDAFVRARGEYFPRVSVLLTGPVPEGEDLLQTSLVRLYRAWQRLDVSSSAPDAYLRKVLVNTRPSWWQVRWRRESPVDSIPDVADFGDFADQYAVGAAVRSALAALPRQLPPVPCGTGAGELHHLSPTSRALYAAMTS
jgi:DNA-directed RNA polymerase specialized sigma24 family protein